MIKEKINNYLCEANNSKAIAVDFDGTLAFYERYSPELGKPISKMVERVKDWLKEGNQVVIFTARITNAPEQKEKIEKWCEEHIGQKLKVTNIKQPNFSAFYDDRAYRVEKNMGNIL